MEPKKYVLGFAFSADKTHVVLIEKQKPEWQKGFFNGVGGKVEESDGTGYHFAMVREFEEETGVKTSTAQWHMFGCMTFNNDVMGGSAKVYCFRMFDDSIYQAKTVEMEKIQIFCMREIPSIQRMFPELHGQKVISNLNVLIPMAADENFEYCELNIK